MITILGAEEVAAVQEVQLRQRTMMQLSRCFTNKSMIRVNIMKSSTKDQIEGKIYQIKGKVKEMVGKISGKPDLETEGKAENIAGKAQEKIGDIEKVIGK